MANCTERWAVDCSIERILRIQKFTSNTSDNSETCLIDVDFFMGATCLIAKPKDEVVSLRGFNKNFEVVTVQVPVSEALNLFPSTVFTPSTISCPCGDYTPSDDFFRLVQGLRECLNGCCAIELTAGFEYEC